MNFPPEIESRLSTIARLELRRIVSDHLRAVGSSHEEIAGVLMKFAPRSDSPSFGPVGASGRSWQEGAVSLAQLAEDLGRLQSTPLPPNLSGEQELAALRTVNAGLGDAVAQLQALLERSR